MPAFLERPVLHPELGDPEFIPRGERRHNDWWLLLLLIGGVDLADADVFWRQHVPPNYGGLLSGQGWAFDVQSQTYRAGNRILDPDHLKRLMILFGESVKFDLEKATRQMARGETTIGQWQSDMADIVKPSHVAAGAAGAGGFNRISAFETIIKGNPDEPIEGMAGSFNRITAFAEDIELRTPRNDTTAGVTARARQYAGPIQHTLEDVRRESHRNVMNGSGRRVFLFERNVLGPNENHCVSGDGEAGCQNLTDAGWLPLGSMPLPGLRRCKIGCLCRLEFDILKGTP